MLVQLRRAVVVSVIFFVLLGLAYPARRDRHRQRVLQPPGGRFADGERVGPCRPAVEGPPVVPGSGRSGQPRRDRLCELRAASEAFVKILEARVRLLRSEGITPTADLVTGSGSGVDPDISPADADAQANAVAKANGLAVAVVRRLIASRIVGPQFDFLGGSYVNVLQLNEALARLR